MCTCVVFQEHAQNLLLITKFFSHLCVFLMCVCVCVTACSKTTATIELYIGVNSVPQLGSVSTGDHLTLRLFPLLQHMPSLL